MKYGATYYEREPNLKVCMLPQGKKLGYGNSRSILETRIIPYPRVIRDEAGNTKVIEEAIPIKPASANHLNIHWEEIYSVRQLYTKLIFEDYV